MGCKLLFPVLSSAVLFFSAHAYGAAGAPRACIGTVKSIELPQPGDIFRNLPLDAGFAGQVQAVKKQLQQRGQLEPIVPMSEKMAEFRREYLAVLKADGNFREAIVRWMESQLRLKSLVTQRQVSLKEAKNEYDLVVIGSGVHGVIAVQAALAVKPNLKVLVIDGGDTAGATFRYAGDTFNINSSNRASGDGRPPLPGQGNINELPGLPVQVSDLSAVKYPTAGDLGSSLVVGLYSAVAKYPNVDILFGTQARSIVKDQGTFKYNLTARIAGNARNTGIAAQKVIVAGGLGTPQLPPGVARAVKRYPELVDARNIRARLPRVMTFEDVMRALNQSNNPRKYFENKKVAVVGTGDSANVFIEFLLGYAVRNGYAQSDAQVAGPKKIFWIGQDKRTCEEFISDIRSRYAQIGTGYRSSDPAGSPVLEGVPPKLASVEPKGNEKVELKLEEAVEGGKDVLDADIVIVATGFKGELAGLLKDLFSERLVQREDLVNDRVFLEKYFEFLEAATSTSPNQKTRVGRYAKNLDSLGRDRGGEPEVVIVGPSAGKLPKDSELVGIIQNTVSIFNNAPRTVAATQTVVRKTKPEAEPAEAALRIPLKADRPQVVEITGISETRNLGYAAQPYLVSVLRSVFAAVESKPVSNADRIVIEFSKSRDGIRISADEVVNLSGIARALVETREFFNLLNLVLQNNAGQSLFVELKQNPTFIETRDIKVTVDRRASRSQNGDVTVLENSSIALRGIEGN